MSDIFFLAVGVMLTGIGLLLITAKVMTYIKCTVPINATVVKPAKEHTYFRGVKHTHYRPVVRYVVDGKSYTEKAYFRTHMKRRILSLFVTLAMVIGLYTPMTTKAALNEI